MLETKHISRLVPNEVVSGLRLSRHLPGTMTVQDQEHAHVQIVHDENFNCLGYLVCRDFGDTSEEDGLYHIYTTDIAEAARLAGLSYAELKNSFQMPDPTVRR